MEKVTIKHHIEKKAQGSYYTIGFDVPADLESVTVSYKYPRSAGSASGTTAVNTVDLGLMDEKGKFLGWSGSARRSIFVGEYGSTNGYLSQRIKPGWWSILVGAYKIEPQGVDVTYEISFEEKKRRLLFGDLHVHSDASDGQCDMPELGRRAKKKGLDFIAAANHNNYAENLSLPHIPGLTFIPAVEWTHYRGHMNFFGVASPFENSFVANSESEMEEVISHAKKLGAAISVNHPKCKLCPYLWKDEESFDMIEVWNGPMRGDNCLAIDWWTEFLKMGRRIPIVGGSDFHRSFRPVRLGNPVTAVMADSPSAGDILSALSQGHSFITESVKGPRLSLQYKDAEIGSTIPYEAGTVLKISVSNLGLTHIVLVTNNGSKRIIGASDGGIVLSEEIKGPGFAYIKAVTRIFGHEIVRAISNPIYFV